MMGTPKAKAEPVRRLSRTPLELFQDLLSPVTALRARALNELVESQLTETDAPIPDATLRAVNLDDDPESEYVFTIHTGWPDTSSVVVADRRPDGWYLVGRFAYQYHWDSEDAERVLEVHAPYLLIRQFGGGTGLSETQARLYRLGKGSLYETLHITEHLFMWTARAPGVASEETRAATLFHPGGYSSEMAIEVRADDTTKFQSVRRAVTRHTCIGYEWTPRTFSFEQNSSATLRLCRPSSR